MSYICATDVLPKELVEAIQQYVSGTSIYIPCKEKKVWGSQTKTKHYYKMRNQEIIEKHINGNSIKMLAEEYSLAEKSIQRIIRSATQKGSLEEYKMEEYQYITLMEQPELKEAAAAWFHSKWGVPKEAYLECMNAYLSYETSHGWYLCLHDGKIVAGLGVIENDFHNRPDLTPNVCAVYTEEAYRKKGIAGKLLNMSVDDMREKGISPVYLVTDHIGFYERYGWEFLCMVQGDGESEMTRMYVHK